MLVLLEPNPSESRGRDKNLISTIADIGETINIKNGEMAR